MRSAAFVTFVRRMTLVGAAAGFTLPAVAAEPKPDAWETLKPYLTPEGAKIFGGARPISDDDRQQ